MGMKSITMNLLAIPISYHNFTTSNNSNQTKNTSNGNVPSDDEKSSSISWNQKKCNTTFQRTQAMDALSFYLQRKIYPFAKHMSRSLKVLFMGTIHKEIHTLVTFMLHSIILPVPWRGWCFPTIPTCRYSQVSPKALESLHSVGCQNVNETLSLCFDEYTQWSSRGGVQ